MAQQASRTGQLMLLQRWPYDTAWKLQREMLEQRAANKTDDTLILLEHPPVFTLGRRIQNEQWSSEMDSLRTHGFDVYATNRGGAITYHGPGQVVGYPILQLRKFCPGPKAYVGKLEEVMIRVLGEWGLPGKRISQWRGVWIGNTEIRLQKIASIGVRITRGVTMHGFALNVNVDLQPFTLITPCGIEGCHVTSMAKELGKPVDIEAVRKRLAFHFGDLFGLDWIEREAVLPT